MSTETRPPASAEQDRGRRIRRRKVIDRSALRLNIRGRSVKLRGLKRPPTGILLVLAVLGPGLITGSAGNDAGGIATYSQAGAKFGYELLWAMVLVTISLMVVQELCARLGAATGRGVLDLVRERYGAGWALFAQLVVLVANTSIVVTEFLALGASAELFGLSKFIAVPVCAALVWCLVIAGSYGRVEKVFIAMTLVFFAYPIAAVLAHPDWGQVIHGLVVPTFHADPDFLLLFVAIVGTTVSPYQQLFQQSATVEKGVARRHYGAAQRVDTFFGMVFSNIISVFMIIAAGATLHQAGKTDISPAADAASALQPVAGDAAQLLFAIGLVGASLIAAAVLPLATAYSVSETFGFRKGVDLDFRRAPIFLCIFTGLILLGAGLSLIPGLPVIQMLVLIQVLNGILLPIILLFLLLLANDRRLCGDLHNRWLSNTLGWGTFVMVTGAVLLLFGTQILGLLGIGPGG